MSASQRLLVFALFLGRPAISPLSIAASTCASSQGQGHEGLAGIDNYRQVRGHSRKFLIRRAWDGPGSQLLLFSDQGSLGPLLVGSQTIGGHNCQFVCSPNHSPRSGRSSTASAEPSPPTAPTAPTNPTNPTNPTTASPSRDNLSLLLAYPPSISNNRSPTRQTRHPRHPRRGLHSLPAN